MPSAYELLGLLILVLVIWFFIKVAKLMVRLFLLFVAVALLAGAVYWFFLR